MALIVAHVSKCKISATKFIPQKDRKSVAVARKLHDATAVLFSLKFANDIHYK